MSLRRDYIGLAALALCVLAFPLLLDNPFYESVAIVIGIQAILVLGLNLLIGYAGQVSLGHAGFFGLGAFLTMALTSKGTPLEDWLAAKPWLPEVLTSFAGWLHALGSAHMGLAAAIAAILTGLVAVAIGYPTLRLKGHYLAVATLGMGIILTIFFNEEYELTGGPSGKHVQTLRLAGKTFESSDTSYYYVTWGLALLLVLAAIHLVHSRPGRALRAIHADEMAAAAGGINVLRLKVSVFALSAVYASLAGSLYAHYLNHINPGSFDFMFSVKLVVMVVVGGMGSIWGSLLGTGLLNLLPQVLAAAEQYEHVIFGAILMLMVMFAPKGLAGLIGDGAKRLVERRGRGAAE